MTTTTVQRDQRSWAWGLALLLTAMAPALLQAQAAANTEAGGVKVTMLSGGIAPQSALIVGASGSGDTRLASAPAFGLELQFPALGRTSVFAGATMAFSSLEHGTNLSTAIQGSTSDAQLLVATGGLLLEAPDDWLGGALHPMLRVGGGLKRYSFSTPGSSSVLTGTGDFGGGLRAGSGALEVSAEVRYLPSSFDQAKLPTRSIVPQKQRQNDLLFGISVTVRP